MPASYRAVRARIDRARIAGMLATGNEGAMKRADEPVPNMFASGAERSPNVPALESRPTVPAERISELQAAMMRAQLTQARARAGYRSHSQRYKPEGDSKRF